MRPFGTRSGLAARLRSLAGAMLACVLCACGLAERQLMADRAILRGVRPTVEEIPYEQVAAAQKRLITALIQQAHLGNTQLGANDPNWELVMNAGLHLVNGHCDQYLNALFLFHREARAGRQTLSAINTATAATLGLTGVAGTTISLVATAFGLSESIFDATTNSVLFQIEPSALRNIAIQGRAVFLADLGRQRAAARMPFSTRPEVMIALQGYLTQCSPAALEANINNAASGSPLAVTSTVNGLLPGTRSGAPTVTLTGRPFAVSAGELRPAAPAPPQQFLARNLLPGETSTGPDIAAIQRALGVAADGNPGPVGSRTREAIAEMQRAMRLATRRQAWTDEPLGMLSGTLTRTTLLAAGPMPAGFATPFERFYLGSAETGFRELDTRRMRTFRSVSLSLSPESPDGWWAGVRAALAQKRRDAGLAAPDDTNAGRLDSILLALLPH